MPDSESRVKPPGPNKEDATPQESSVYMTRLGAWNWKVRRAAVKALGDLGDTRAIPLLCKALVDKRDVVRAAARNALVQIGEPAILALQHVLLHPDDGKWWWWDGRPAKAAQTLGRIGAPAIPVLCDALQTLSGYEAKVVRRALIAIGGDACAALCQLLEHDEPNARINAAEALGELRDIRSFEPLCHALKAPDELMRLDEADVPLASGEAGSEIRAQFAIVRALGKLGGPAIPLLRSYLPGSSGVMRRNLLEFVGVGSEVAIAQCEVLRDSNYRWARRAAILLGRLKDPVAIEPLHQALREAHEKVRAHAVNSLGEIGGPDVFVPLCTGLKDSDWGVRSNAAAALGRLGHARGVSVLCQACRDRNDQVRQSARLALGKLGDATTLPHRVLACTDFTAAEKVHALNALRSVRCLNAEMSTFRCKIGPLPSYCEALCLQEGVAADVKMGAQSVLEHLRQCADTAILLRPSHGGSGKEKETLLRALSEASDSAPSEHLLRQSQFPQELRKPARNWLARLFRGGRNSDKAIGSESDATTGSR